MPLKIVANRPNVWTFLKSYAMGYHAVGDKAERAGRRAQASLGLLPLSVPGHASGASAGASGVKTGMSLRMQSKAAFAQDIDASGWYAASPSARVAGLRR